MVSMYRVIQTAEAHVSKAGADLFVPGHPPLREQAALP